MRGSRAAFGRSAVPVAVCGSLLIACCLGCAGPEAGVDGDGHPVASEDAADQAIVDLGPPKLPAVPMPPDAATAFAEAGVRITAAQDAGGERQIVELLIGLAHLRAGLDLEPTNWGMQRRYQDLMLALARVDEAYVDRLLDEFEDLWDDRRPSARAAHLYGRILAVAGRVDDAADVADEGLTQDGNNFELLHLRGSIAFERREMARAGDLLGRAAMVGQILGRYDAARLYARWLLVSGRSDARERAIVQLRSLIERSSLATFEDVELLANLLIESEQYGAAKGLLLDGIPTRLLVASANGQLRLLGRVYVAEGHLDRAVWAFDTYLHLHADSPDADAVRAERDAAAVGVRRESILSSGVVAEQYGAPAER